MSDPFLTSPTLLKRLADRADQEAWVRFVDLYAPLIMRFLHSREPDEAEVEEVVQRVCIRILESIGRFSYDRSKGRFRSYLGTITAREYVKRQKERKPTYLIDEQVAGPALEAEWEDTAKGYILGLAMDRIRPEFPDDTWEAFRRLWLEGCEVAILEAELDRSANWIYQAKHHVLKRLDLEVARISAEEDPFNRS